MNIISNSNTVLNSNFHNFSFSDVVFRFKEYSKELTRQSIIECLETIDNKYFKSKLWKRTHKNHGFKERTLLTSIGVITFKRRYYIALDKSQGTDNFFYVDNLLGIHKYSRLSIDAIIELTKVATEVNSSYAARKALIDTEVSRQTVSNILQNYKIVDQDLPRIDEIIEKYNESKETIYIELDEAHCNLQEKQANSKRSKNIIANLALLHTGHSSKTLASKRKELENKHYFGGLNADTSLFADRIYDYILKRFKANEIKYIFVSGDGAKWINSFASNLRNCFREYNIRIIQVLDKFHLRKRLTSIFSGNKDMINFFFSNLKTLDENQFKIIARYFYENNPDHKLNPIIFNSHVRYICNNFKYIKNQLHPKYKTSCSMEGHVSHVLASRLTSRPKGFKRTTLENLIQLLVMRANLHELTIQDILEWKKPIQEIKKVRSIAANKMYKKFYDFNIELAIKESNNTKVKDFIHKLTSPKWLYS